MGFPALAQDHKDRADGLVAVPPCRPTKALTIAANVGLPLYHDRPCPAQASLSALRAFLSNNSFRSWTRGEGDLER
jgi:hypothetical protein